MKRAVLASFFSALMLLAFAAPASAQDQPAPAADGEKKVKTYDFTGDEIDGELIKPDGDFIDTRGTAEFASLIRIRQDFLKEILKSAEDL